MGNSYNVSKSVFSFSAVLIRGNIDFLFNELILTTEVFSSDFETCVLISSGLQEAAILPCLRRDGMWSERAGAVENPLPTGREWRRGEDRNEGQQVNTPYVGPVVSV